MLKYPQSEHAKDELVQNQLMNILGTPQKYDKYLDPLNSGPHLNNIQDKAFFRANDRAMGYSSPHQILNQHRGNVFPGAKRLFKQSPTSVLLKWPNDVDPPEGRDFFKAPYEDRLPFVQMNRQINRQNKSIAKALKDQKEVKDSPMVLRVLNEALGKGDKDRAKQEKKELVQNPFLIDYSKQKKNKNVLIYDPEENYDSEEEKNQNNKANKNKKSYI